MSLIPGLSCRGEFRPADERGGPIVDIRQRLWREHQRLPDRQAQRQLLERLRVKYSGHPVLLFRKIRTGVQSGDGLWWWLFVGAMLWPYFRHWGMGL